MNAPNRPDEFLARDKRVDELCDRFKRQWLAGEVPRLEKTVEQASAVDRPKLLRELLLLELELRRSNGESPAATEYDTRFPDDTTIVSKAFAYFASQEIKAAGDTVNVSLNPSEETHVPDDREATRTWVPDNSRDLLDGRRDEPPQAGADRRRSPGSGTGPGRAAPQRFGDYELLEEIARGGMGVVYKARQTKLNRIVALKMIKSGELAGDDDVQRFHAEAEAAAQLDHPNIVPIYEVGEQSGQHFFSMGFVEGAGLDDRLKDGPLPPAEAAELIRTIAEAVQYAHEKGIVHRDLKPANVLLPVESAGAETQPTRESLNAQHSTLNPRITDFGLAKNVAGDSGMTATGQILGTPSYMPPEQAAGKTEEIGPAADVYSLGAMLYATLTGRPPFQAANVMETLKQVLEEEPVSPRQLNPAVDRDLETICLKCLEKDADKRYATARGLADDLARYIAGRPILARPIGKPARLWRWCRRNRTLAIVGGTALILLLTLSIGGPLMAARQAELKEDAVDEAARADAAAKDATAALTREQAAKRDAERKRREAETNLAYAKKGNDILGSVFTGLDPKKNYATVAELRNALRDNLKQAVQELDGSAIGDPLTVAEMQNTLGLSLLALGEHQQAITLFAKAQATRTKSLGPDHPDTLRSMNNLAVAYEDGGQLAKALPLYEETLAKKKARLGPDHPSTLNSMISLAEAYRAGGQLTKALPLLKVALKKRKARLGPDHPDTLTSMNNLAGAYQSGGQLAKALPLLKETLAKAKAKLGPDHPITLASMNNLANAYRAGGQLAKALPLLKETLAKAKSVLGPDHPYTLASMNSLAVAYYDDGQLAKALPLYEETLKKRMAKLGPEHPDTLTSMGNLAGAYQAGSQVAKALPLHEETLKKRKAKLGPDHPDTLQSMYNLAVAYYADGQLAKALPLFEETLAKRMTKLGPDHPKTIASRKYLNVARTFLSLQERHRGRSAKLGPGHIDTLLARRDLAQAYMNFNKLDQAEKILTEVIAAMKDRAPDDPILAFTIGLLRRCATVREKTGPQVWQTFNTQSMLGGVLLDRKNYADAEPLLLKAYAGMKQREKTIPAQARVRLREALQRLVQLYDTTGKKDDAAKWRKELQAFQPTRKKAAKK